jgi:hypothetical protein
LEFDQAPAQLGHHSSDADDIGIPFPSSGTTILTRRF